MAKTSAGLVAHAAAQVGNPYWWGTFGQIATAALLADKAKQYPDQFAGSRVATAKAKHLGKRVYDCCGLIKSYMMQATPTAKPKYNSSYDQNVGGLKTNCKVKGVISNLPEIPGVLLFRGTAHVGVYAGNGVVIEAKGFDYGVVKSKLSEGRWDAWGKLSWITYPSAPKATSTPTPVPAVKDAIYGTERKYNNTSGKALKVYADTTLKTEIGELFDGSSCTCLGVVAGRALIKYKVAATGAYKVGFTAYTAGIK